MLNDLKYAFRVIRKYPLSNSVVVLTIGLLVAVIGVFYSSLRNEEARYLPFQEPDRLVKFWRVSPKANLNALPAPVFRELQTRAQSFDKIGALVSHNSFTLTGQGEPLSVYAVQCTSEVLEIAGFAPLAGRLFSKTDELPGNRKLVILSEALWRSRFDASPEAPGRTITLNDEEYVVVGVAPGSLDHTYLASNADLWMPHGWEPSGGRAEEVTVVARLKPGVSRQSAQAELKVLSPQLDAPHLRSDIEQKFHGNVAFSTELAPLDKSLQRRSWRHLRREALIVLFGITLAGSVVLIACFNLTCLFLVQSASRARELAVRISVGAGRARIVRQLLLESMLLAGIGGALGLPLAFWLKQLAGRGELNLTFDPQLFGYAFGMAFVIGALVSVVPALRSGRTDLSLALKNGGPSSSTRRRHGLRNFLVGAQVGMATILTIVALLFGRGFLSVYLQDPDFEPERLVEVNVDLRETSYPEGEDVASYARQALRAVEEMPGVEAAAVSSAGVTSPRAVRSYFRFREPDLSGGNPSCGRFHLSPRFPKLVGQKLVQGRSFSHEAEAMNEALVNEKFVQEYLTDEESLGRMITLEGEEGISVMIVGVLSDRDPRLSPAESQPEVYLSHRHPSELTRQVSVLVKTRADAGRFGLAVRERLKLIDTNQPIGAATPVADAIEKRMKPIRSVTLLLLSMAGFGLFMALMGVYGVVAHSVIERTREMGIRMALGAGRRRLAGLITNEGTRLMIWGGVPGTMVAAGVTQGLPPEFLKAVNAHDPWSFLLGVIVVAIAGALAAVIPASQIVHLNPNEALRHE